MQHRGLVPASLLILLVAGSGCTLPRNVIAEGDSAGLDVGTFDAGTDDVGSDDAGREDAGPPVDADLDAGPPRDSGPPDTGIDAFGLDVGPPVDVGVDAWVPECTAGETRCTGEALDTCSGGVWVSGAICPLGCIETGVHHCGTFAPANVADSLTGSGPDVRIDASAARIDTMTCTGLPGATGRVVAQSDGGPMVCLFELGSLSVTATGIISGYNARPLVFVAHGPVTIDGGIDVSSYTSPPTGGAAYSGAGAGTGGDVGDPGGGGGGVTDGGGGGGAFGGNGGNGGNGGSGSSGGAGGSAVASTLTPLVGGASGGMGSGGAGGGGAGGGAIQITSFVSIVVNGGVFAAGAGGIGGSATGAGAGGGGGSGGAILLEAPSVTLGAGFAGVALTVAGGGGAAGGCIGTGAGPNGQDGALALLSRATGGAGLCGQREGGLGGGMATNNGATAGNAASNGAGGGGSVGRIMLRTSSGATPAGPTSPTGTSAVDTDTLTVL